jgi:predicted MPP superfamily phosphohydrolase
MTVRRPFLSPAWLIFSLPGYIGWRLLGALPWQPWTLVSGVTLLLAACIVIPMSVRTRDRRNQKNASRIAWIGLTAMGFLSTLFVFTVLRDVALLGTRLFISGPRFDGMVERSAMAILLAAVLATVAGFITARRPRIVNVEIPIDKLPAALHGFIIAQISDVHVGPTIKRRFVENIVRRVNGLHADVIAVTGDLVDGSVEALAEHTAPFASLSARYGTYFVTGNHEYYSGERAWCAEVSRLNMRVLKNEHVVIRHNGAALLLAGVTDYSAHHFDPAQRSDPAASLRGAPADIGAKILLAHQPSTSTAAQAAGFDLQISGHTHGGQFWPWNFFIRYFQPFTKGLNRLGSMKVYVSRGTGYWGPPNRFGVPAEITRISLVPAGA